jgi:hypothetical protein
LSDNRPRLEFTGATLVSLNMNRQGDGVVKTICKFETPIDSTITEFMGIKGVYKPDGTPEYVNETRGLDKTLIGAEMTVPAGVKDQPELTRTYATAKIAAFHLSIKGPVVIMSFVVHIHHLNNAFELLALRAEYLKPDDEFTIVLRPSQMEFNWDGKKADGNQVEMGSEDAGAAEASGPLYASEDAEEPEGQGSLADLRDVEGKRQAKHRGRTFQEPISDEELQKDMGSSVQ